MRVYVRVRMRVRVKVRARVRVSGRVIMRVCEGENGDPGEGENGACECED